MVVFLRTALTAIWAATVSPRALKKSELHGKNAMTGRGTTPGESGRGLHISSSELLLQAESQRVLLEALGGHHRRARKHPSSRGEGL